MDGEHVLIATVLEVHGHLAAALEGDSTLGSAVSPSTLLIIVVLEEEVMPTQVENAPALLPSLVERECGNEEKEEEWN